MIHNVPKDSYVESAHHTCEYHKAHPNQPNYAGCTCSSSWILKTGKPPKEKENVQEIQGPGKED